MWIIAACLRCMDIMHEICLSHYCPKSFLSYGQKGMCYHQLFFFFLLINANIEICTEKRLSYKKRWQRIMRFFLFFPFLFFSEKEQKECMDIFSANGNMQSEDFTFWKLLFKEEKECKEFLSYKWKHAIIRVFMFEKVTFLENG